MSNSRSLLTSSIALAVASLAVALLIAHAPNAAEPESKTPANVEGEKRSTPRRK